MIDPKTKLTIFHDDNGSFTDHTENAADYLRDDYSIDLSSTEDYLYIGYYKPFGTTYMEITTANTNANDLSIEYWNGTAWTSVTPQDETKGFTRSGFIFWNKESMSSTTVNSVEKFYIRMRPSADHTATDVRGTNLVFADDHMLKQEFFEINDANLLPAGQSSHIDKHVASRNFIIQKLRNEGYIKTDSNGDRENITQWDLMDSFEIRQAATFLALSKIFFNLSDSVDDNWWQKYTTYQNKFNAVINGWARVTVDYDDDGINDDAEKASNITNTRWSR